MLRSLVLVPALGLLLASSLAWPLAVIAQEATPAAASPVAFVWQSAGGPALPLGSPGQMALDPQGNLWVPDGVNSVIQLFAPAGTFLETWGTPGSAEGQFNFVHPGGFGAGAVAFATDGTLYVADTGNRRVQAFDSKRRFLTAWGGEGSGDGQFQDPSALAVGRDGAVYVVDVARNDIQAFEPDGRFRVAFGGLGTGDGKFRTPGFLAVGPDGDVWVADNGNNRVERFAPDGTFVAAWGSAGGDAGELLNPLGVAVDDRGRVYVADYGNSRVQVFDGEGRVLAAWGEYGAGEGQFKGPNSIVLDGAGHAYVDEWIAGRVQQFRLLPPLAPEATPTP